MKGTSNTSTVYIKLKLSIRELLIVTIKVRLQSIIKTAVPEKLLKFASVLWKSKGPFTNLSVT